MQVIKRNGGVEDVNLDKIISSLTKTCSDLKNIDIYKIATKTIGGLYNRATTVEIDNLSIQTAIGLIIEDPEYSKAAARILVNVINKEVEAEEIQSFSQSIDYGQRHGLINGKVQDFVKKNARKLNAATKAHTDNDNLYEYFGLKTVYDRYLLRSPESRHVFETPQYWLMRVACGLFNSDVNDTIEFFKILSSHKYMTSTPTLFNSGTCHTQMSSCYLLDSPQDDLEDIYKRYKDIAMLSKFAGGIGVDFTYVRSEGSLIKGTNGLSNGVIPFIHTLDSSVSAVNQGGRRKGAACVYLESWHPDIFSFLELRKQTGDPMRRAFNLNFANWVPDELMRRVKEDKEWTLITPSYPRAHDLTQCYGDDFERLYCELEAELDALPVKPKWYKKVPARELFTAMMRTLSETGNGWMNFKDSANRKANQVNSNARIVRISNLCTEILEVVDGENTAVCNLGSINVSKFLKSDGKINWKELERTIKLAVRGLDAVIDDNFYPIPEAKNSNSQWRPVGLGIMGLQEMFFKLRVPFDSVEAADLTEKIHGFIYYYALETSVDLAKEYGPCENFKETRTASGFLQFDLWNAEPVQFNSMNWEILRAEIKTYGLRNSLLIAIAPTATIASIVGTSECIEPQTSNLFKRETLSGEFVQINSYLVNELKALGLWNEDVKAKIIAADGSIQQVYEIPEGIREIYKTTWELSQRTLIDLAAIRGKYIDQSQSLNLFIENPNIGKLSSMYTYAWEKGLKTTYYLRSRSATRIAKTAADKPAYSDQEALVCSLENPGACEACT